MATPAIDALKSAFESGNDDDLYRWNLAYASGAFRYMDDPADKVNLPVVRHSRKAIGVILIRHAFRVPGMGANEMQINYMRVAGASGLVVGKAFTSKITTRGSLLWDEDVSAARNTLAELTFATGFGKNFPRGLESGTFVSVFSGDDSNKMLAQDLVGYGDSKVLGPGPYRLVGILESNVDHTDKFMRVRVLVRGAHIAPSDDIIINVPFYAMDKVVSSIDVGQLGIFAEFVNTALLNVSDAAAQDVTFDAEGKSMTIGGATNIEKASDLFGNLAGVNELDAYRRILSQRISYTYGDVTRQALEIVASAARESGAIPSVPELAAAIATLEPLVPAQEPPPQIQEIQRVERPPPGTSVTELLSEITRLQQEAASAQIREEGLRAQLAAQGATRATVGQAERQLVTERNNLRMQVQACAQENRELKTHIARLERAPPGSPTSPGAVPPLFPFVPPVAAAPDKNFDEIVRLAREAAKLRALGKDTEAKKVSDEMAAIYALTS